MAKPVQIRKNGAKPAVEADPGDAAASFPVVALGASAGGLEALEQFLAHVPAGSGMAVASFRGIGTQPEVISQMETNLRDKYHDIQIPAVREVQEGTKVLSAFQATLRIRSRPMSRFQELLKPGQLSADQSSSTVAEKRRTKP